MPKDMYSYPSLAYFYLYIFLNNIRLFSLLPIMRRALLRAESQTSVIK